MSIGERYNKASDPARPRFPVVVLGAGVAGLRAALFLLERGYDVELLEKLGEPGGMARSHERNGYVFDHGPHGFFSRDEWILEEFKELLGDDGYRWLTKWSQISYRGHYFNYPLKLADLASKMSPFTLVAALFSFLWTRLGVALTKRQPANAEEYLSDQFGRVLYNEFFGPFTKKVWDIDPRALDADFARDRVPSVNLWDVIRKLFTDPEKEQSRVTPSGRVATHDLHVFFYPLAGARALPDAYAAKIRELGGRFRLNADLQRIDLENRCLIGESSGEPFRLPYAGLVSTIPIEAVVEVLDPAPPAEIRTLADALRYRAVMLINLCIRKPEVIGPFWIYFTDRFFNRISEYRHFSPELVPSGKTGICLEVGCNEGDELWGAEDAEIVNRCVEELVDLELVQVEDIEDHFIIREGNAYPIYDVGYKARINELVGWLENEAGIMTAGRQGRFLYINQDAAIKSGYEAAEAIARMMETGAVKERPVWDEGPRRKIIG